MLNKSSTSLNKVCFALPPCVFQDILLMKGEGEVKLNMAVGKGEQVLKHNSVEGQEAICSQLQNLKDAWANMLMTSMSCHRYGTLLVYPNKTTVNLLLQFGVAQNMMLCV